MNERSPCSCIKFTPNVAKHRCKIQRLAIWTQRTEPGSWWINECRSLVWFLTLRVPLSGITTSMKGLSSKQRRSIPRWGSSHPSDYPNSTYRRALFSRVLTLNGQRNYHQQLVSCSERERLTFVRLSLQRHHWHTDKTPMSDLLKEIFPNVQRKPFLPFWVCPSSMSSSIMLVCFRDQDICENKCLCCRFKTLFIFKG